MNIPEKVNLTVESETAREVLLLKARNEFYLGMTALGISLFVVLLFAWGVRSFFRSINKK